jgi:hypothetical protein
VVAGDPGAGQQTRAPPHDIDQHDPPVLARGRREQATLR